VDEFEAMGLFHYLDTVWPLASVFIGDGAHPKSLNNIQECMAAQLKQLGIHARSMEEDDMDALSTKVWKQLWPID
jgi:hypothetical protein